MYKYKLGLLGCMAGFNQLFVEFKGALTGQFACQKLKTVQDINVNLKMYSFDHLRMYNIDHINTCCSRW